MLKLDTSQIDCLEVVIGEDTYMVPAFTNLSYKEYKELNKIRKKSKEDAADWMVEYLSKYIPCVEELTMIQISEILNALVGLEKVGESSAS